MMISVVTPSYNRAKLLPRLYESLKKQTFKDYEWLLIDDGSTDNTGEVVKAFTEVPMRYIRQTNGGKHRAINRALKEAKGKLFFIVDSDDWLREDALALMNEHYQKIKDDDSFIGVSGMRCDPTGEHRIGGEIDFQVKECTAYDYWDKLKVDGDSAEAFKTEMFRKFPFPDYEGEKFCPEAYVWYRMARRGYKLRYINEKIYYCDYQDNGLSSKITQVRVKSPWGSFYTYWEGYISNRPLRKHIRMGINAWRFWLHCPKGRKPKERPSLMYLLLGWLLYQNDKRTIK